MIVTGADGGIVATAFFAGCAAIAVWQLRPGLLETETRTVETLLARYPGPLVLRASVKKLLFVAAVSSVFGGVMLWMVLHEAPPMAIQIMLWPGVVLFLGGAPILILLAIQGSTLHLDATGLMTRQMGRSRRWNWHALSGFTVAAVKGSVQRLVVFDDANLGTTRFAALNRRLTGRNASLPDSYGLDPDALAALLAAWCARAVRDDVGRR
ncbi:hypothetical protein [Consotaella aegiceratis]|uniref:hypothetical protein n=1 Tax=Consotaella aegiceratis TaxID=3097961 RepID=UPI002F3F9EBE